MNNWQWLQFQSFSRQVLEPTHKSQLDKLDEWIFEPYTKTVTDPMSAYRQTERWAANNMYGMHLTNAPRLALELLQHIGLFALGCAQEEGFTAEAKKSLWQETRRICTQLAPYLPEPDRAALLALLPVEDDAPVVKEKPEDRRARWLDMFEAEEKREKRGALQRLADSENVDRSNMKKDIDKARGARDAEKRAGTWTSQLVQDGKRPY